MPAVVLVRPPVLLMGPQSLSTPDFALRVTLLVALPMAKVAMSSVPPLRLR